MYRVRLLFAFFALLLLLVWLRLFYWQVIKGDQIQSIAYSEHTGRFTLKANRGEFFTSDKFPFVINVVRYRVVADPQKVDSVDDIARKFSSIVIDEEDFQRSLARKVIHEATGSTEPARLQYEPAEKDSRISEEEKRLKDILIQKKLRWAQLYKYVQPDIKEKMEKLNFNGIHFEETFGRIYPEASLSGTLVGLLTSDVNGNPKGSYGIEGKYEGELSGKEGRLRQEQDSRGRIIIAGDNKEIDARHGSDLILNIDRTIQYLAHKKLLEGVQKFGAKGGTVIIMDPISGGILAMTSVPALNPEQWEYFPQSWYKNPAVADTYEPGSTFKSVVMAAGLDAGVINYSTVCPVCNGPRKVGPFLIRTWNNQYQNNPTMVDILVHSDNTGMVYIGDLLGKERLRQYLWNFGFGQVTGIDLQDEASSVLRKSEELRDIDAATHTFGQGIAVTPIQMVRAVAAIANKGLLMEPHIVKSINRGDQSIAIEPKMVRRVISEKAALTMTDIMVKSAEHGEAKFAALAGYKVAGKTGTAQIPIDGVYDASKTIASFVGFAPADNPKFIMLVIINEPSSSQWGSETAAPLFYNITNELMRYYGIAPQT